MREIICMRRRKPEKAEKVLERFVSGYHEYYLGNPSFLTYVSTSLCELTQYSKEELTGTDTDLYMSLVHPADCGKYRRFLNALKEKEGTLSLEYRLVKRNGDVLHVYDTMTSRKDAAGKLVACSTLADITKLKREVTEHYERKISEQENRFFEVISGIYDLIFEFDRNGRTVKCLRGNLSHIRDYLEGIPMQLDTAADKWLNQLVIEEDRNRLRRFLRLHVLLGPAERDGSNQIRIGIQMMNSHRIEYQAVLLETDGSHCYFCCREAEKTTEPGLPHRENGHQTDQNEEMRKRIGHCDGQGQEKESVRDKRVMIRTFGSFDVFADDRAIMFRTEKAKELLAILVDRRGGYVTPEEAIALLWEDEPASPVVLARYRKVALRLKNQLEEYGISDIVESVNGKRRLVTERVDCDLYQYLSGTEEGRTLFHGYYLTNYSWGEVTLGELMDCQ